MQTRKPAGNCSGTQLSEDAHRDMYVQESATPKIHLNPLLFVLCLFLAISSLSAQTEKWVGTWSAAPYLVEPQNMPPSPGLSNNSLRQIVRVSIGGSRLRVKFSNRASSNSTTINAVTIAASTSGYDAIDVSTLTELKFGGSSAVTMNAGASATSDPVDFALTPGMRLAITIYYGQVSSSVTGHVGSRTNSYLLTGNRTTSGNFSGAASTQHWYTINTIDVLTSNSAAAVAVIGNSITDGYGLTPNLQNRWTDAFSESLLASQPTENVGVLNLGIGATNVASGTNCGLDRYQQDILGQNGLEWFIIYYGVNDINAGASANTIINAYRTMMQAAQAQNIKVYCATLTPFNGQSYYTSAHEAVRNTVNEWIRTTDEHDGFIDFDEVLRDPSDHTRLQAVYSNDWLHPNTEGYRVMGESIDPDMFIPTVEEGIIGQIDLNTQHQTMDGFGGGITWGNSTLHTNVQKNAIYDLLFNDLGLDIVRIRNVYGRNESSTLEYDRQTYTAAKSRNSDIKFLLTSWSPPAALKDNNSVLGSGENATLKYENGSFMYDEFGAYWQSAFNSYASLGVTPDYISIQNEPDWDITEWETCRLRPFEEVYNGKLLAGYNTCLDKVYERLGGSTRFLGPEVTGVGYNKVQDFIDVLDQDKIDVIANHIYNGGDTANPDTYIENLQGIAAKYPDKKIWQTETDVCSPFKTAWLMHNCLTEGRASGYIHWKATWTAPDTRSFIAVNDGSGYSVNKYFHYFKQFSKFISEGYTRVGASCNASDVKISAFINPEGDQLTVVCINTGTTTRDVAIDLGGYPVNSSSIYRTSGSENFVSAGSLDGENHLSLPGQSVSTIVIQTTVSSHIITATAQSGGSISPSGEVTVFNHGSETFTITPDAGNRIAAVLADGVSTGTGSSYTFSDVTSDHTIEATFEAAPTHTITASAGNGGSISPSGAVTVTEGTSQTFTITPSTGYAVASLLIDGSPVAATTSYTFSDITADHTISVTFAVAGFTITATAGNGGAITPSGAVSAAYGSSHTFTITPDDGYYITDVTVDGVSAGAVSSYTIASISADHTISASFGSLTVYQINCGGNSASPFSSDQYYSGGTTYSKSNSISTTGLTDPAPQSVYQSERYGTMTYTIPNLTSGAEYTVRLHFAELYWTATGKRVFDVVINGDTVMTNYDIYAETGGQYRADIHEFITAANSSGQIVINFFTVTDNAKIDGIEIIRLIINNAPSITTPASASINPVTGFSTELSVRADDDNGEENLTYTWAATGTPPAAVSFSNNESNDAKTTTATFSNAGTYSLKVTVTDAGGRTTTSSVNVTVDQTLSSIAVTPANVTVNVSATQQFTATARDQFSDVLSAQPSFSWDVTTGGTISSSGLFTAGPSTGTALVTATAGGMQGTANVSVNAAPAIENEASAAPSPVTGTTTQLSVLGTDDNGEAALIYTWATAGTPPAAVSFSSNGSNSAKNCTVTFTEAGTYSFIVTVEDAGHLEATSTVDVTVEQTPTSVAVSPASATVTTSSTQQFTATIKDQFGNGMTAAVTWHTYTGTITGSGLYTAASFACEDTVAAVVNPTLTGEAGITVVVPNDPPTIATPAAATPSPVTGTSTALSVLGADDNGEANLTYTWETTGTPPATVAFNANGTNSAKNSTVTFPKAGSYSFLVTVRDGGNLTVTSTVSVTVNQTTTGITVSPSGSTLNTMETRQFSAVARDQFGEMLSVQPSFSWNATGVGSVNSSGLYSAGSIAGSATVTASVGGNSGSAGVTVIAAPTTVYQINTGTNSSASPFSADQYGSGGTMRTVSNSIDMSGVTEPAPHAVYQSERYGNSTYTIPNLTPTAEYKVRLHFAELYQTATGKRRFNVAINGTTVLSNFDIYAVTGARYKAIIREFTTNANGSGQIIITFTTVTDNATIEGIEIIQSTPNYPPTIVEEASATPSPVTGNSTVLSVLGDDESGEAELTYTWETTGTPPGTVTFSVNGTNSAKNTTATFTGAGVYTFQVTATDAGSLTATSSVNVTVDQTLTSVTVSPAVVTLDILTTQQFSATARDQFGTVLSTQPPFSWSVISNGNITQDGAFTAGSTAGSATVTAVSGGKSGSATVTIVVPDNAPTIDQPAAATPSPVTGTSTVLSVLGADDNGEANLTYTWATTGTVPGTVTFGINGSNSAKNSTATFTKAGTYSFIVTVRDQGGKSVTSTVSVSVDQTITSIVLSPATVSLSTSASQQFTATARDQFGTNLSTQPGFSWSRSGVGTINSNGLYSAGTTAGSATITAASNGISANADVTVTAEPTMVYQINCGGNASSPYSSDQYYSGGTTYSVSNSVTTSGITDPAPQAVYRSERYGNLTYTLPGLTAGTTYKVRLHFAELYWTGTGKRRFNVVINGSTVLSNYDIYAETGARYKAVVKEYTATADGSGEVVINFNTVTDNAKIDGIEIIRE